MENIIGIEFSDTEKGMGAVITWGNVFDEHELLMVVESVLYTRFRVYKIE